MFSLEGLKLILERKKVLHVGLSSEQCIAVLTKKKTVIDTWILSLRYWRPWSFSVLNLSERKLYCNAVYPRIWIPKNFLQYMSRLPMWQEYSQNCWSRARQTLRPNIRSESSTRSRWSSLHFFIFTFDHLVTYELKGCSEVTVSLFTFKSLLHIL